MSDLKRVSASIRSCAGCRRPEPRTELLRLAIVDLPPYVVPDPKGRLGGRGAWLHAELDCVERATRKGGFARSMRRSVTIDGEALSELIRHGLKKRFESILGGGYRSRNIVIGTDAVRESMDKKRIRVLGVAIDAAGRRQELSRRADRVAIFGTKQEIGAAFGKDEVAVYSIEDDGIGNEVLKLARQLAGLRHADAFTYEDVGSANGRGLGDRKNA